MNRAAPAPYVRAMLAQAALDRGDLQQAQKYARQLPVSPRRDDLLGYIAQARGNAGSAAAHFIAARDIFAIGRQVQDLSRRNPWQAYQLELQLNRRLQQTSTHPDALAESYWQLGVFAAYAAKPALAIQQYRAAVDLSPLSSKYLISAGFQSYDLQRYADARTFFARAIEVDPGSADAYAGAGMTALRLGDRAAAVMYEKRSRACDPHSHALATLEQLLK